MLSYNKIYPVMAVLFIISLAMQWNYIAGSTLVYLFYTLGSSK